MPAPHASATSPAIGSTPASSASTGPTAPGSPAPATSGDPAAPAPAALRYHTVIFDCDGTLLDTIEDLAAAGNAVCARHGWPTFSIAQYKRKVGNGLLVLAQRLLPPELADDPAAQRQARKEFAAFYAEHKDDHTAPYPGILSALDALRATGVRLAVLTNKDDAPAQQLVAHHFGERFACVQGRTDGLPAKPAPAMMHAALRRLGIDPNAADATRGLLMVGDSDVDIQAGANVGMDTCGVLWGFRDRTELAGAGATHLAATPAELVGIVRDGIGAGARSGGSAQDTCPSEG